MADEKSTAEKFGEDVQRQLTLDLKAFTAASDALSEYSNQVNETFTQGRQRISEISTALADATPNVTRLGGDIKDVADIIGKVAAESRRNVIANTEDVEKLFAANKVLGLDAQTLTKAFSDIGAGIETIPEALEESVQYIQSIGGNAKAVMGDVTQNMEQMNRYQFEGGVKGLTKMAAQASMLRFDMNETFRLADKVISPEGAIEVASAFQRLGVAAGALADPFQLMNQSINDPKGLQDSLANVAKQFAEYDEKTKTFKINPQGVLTLKEMEQQTGVSAKEMSKMALAAAEIDKRLTDVNKAGLKFGTEEDKQYLANIAKMGESGKYEVELKDGTKKELASLNQDEFDELIKAQKDQPKTMEDIARAQMTTSDIIKGDVSAIRNALLGGVISPRGLLQGAEGARKVATTGTGEISKRLSSTEEVRNQTTQLFGTLKDFIKDMSSGDMKTTDAAAKALTKVGTQMQGIEQSLIKNLTDAVEAARNKTGDSTGVERLAKAGYDKLLGQPTGKKADGSRPISTLIEGNRSQQIQSEVKQFEAQGGSKTQVDFGGGIKIDVNFSNLPSDLSPQQREQFTKMFIDKFNSVDVQQYISNVKTQGNPTKAPVGKTLSP
jgi:hypothetical protein